jgi:hypothetical protein
MWLLSLLIFENDNGAKGQVIAIAVCWCQDNFLPITNAFLIAYFSILHVHNKTGKYKFRLI